MIIGTFNPKRIVNRPLAAPATIDPIWYSATVQETKLIPPISSTMAGIMVATNKLSAACNQTAKQTSDSEEAYCLFRISRQATDSILDAKIIPGG